MLNSLCFQFSGLKQQKTTEMFAMDYSAICSRMKGMTTLRFRYHEITTITSSAEEDEF